MSNRLLIVNSNQQSLAVGCASEDCKFTAQPSKTLDGMSVCGLHTEILNEICIALGDVEMYEG